MWLGGSTSRCKMTCAMFVHVTSWNKRSQVNASHRTAAAEYTSDCGVTVPLTCSGAM